MLPCVCVLSHWSCPTLFNPMDYSQPDSSVHGIIQARILECPKLSNLNKMKTEEYPADKGTG